MPTVRVDEHELADWCQRHLGSRVAEVLFAVQHLSAVRGVRLEDGRSVVVKVRADSARLTACAAVQRHLFRAGFACPEPLAGPLPLGGFAASAEVLVPDGEIATLENDTVSRHARLLADLVRLAPPAAGVGNLSPAPPWVAWDHGELGLWPAADDRDEDLNAVQTAPWLDEVALAVRRRLEMFDGGEKIVGHGDFEAQNIRWHGPAGGGEPLAVHDWDSVIATSEPLLAGFAAAVWPAGMKGFAQATVPQTEAFLGAYQRARGISWSDDALGAAWAAGLWVLAFNAKKASIDGVESLSQSEAAERLTRGGS
ncbi:hypothetical protein Rhe02_88030 [Rhizocola hellebori]|uniref:Aminoglycoside phosphotransferase domain-containing protein n=1 Tax=Rhizocola hellebori TaxID=1392758 RepID=A0A8J3VM18_9ACTN|nr:hypothetical protein [Rhizocola hellebori]GIH10736.1 hypothetical protein Rhe02_88030 [Rhizocola hellebori]